MKAIDTNIAARFLLDDDPVQVAQATAVLEDPTFISQTVLLELGWLLASRYRLDRTTVAHALLQLIDMPMVTVAHSEHVRWALARYVHRGDLADLMHLIATANAEAFVTLDRALAAQAGADSPVPIETLG